MARKKIPPSSPSNAYLVSFGDTMTALLAFFIVLNSLATEQTGANLYSGTGSFTQVGDSMGVPGLFAAGLSTNAAQMEHPSPIYIVADGDEESDGRTASGPDKDGDANLIQDRENDELQRFLLEMERMHRAKGKDVISGEVAFDRFAPLRREGEIMDEAMQEELLRFAPILRRSGYELEIRVWATTPAPSAWTRAANQALQVHTEVLKFLKLRSDQVKKITATASPWHTSDVKRPVLSYLLRRVKK